MQCTFNNRDNSRSFPSELLNFLPDHEVDGGPNGESDEPEPEEDVDLLVDDVHGQYAEAVLALDGAGGTVLVEGALGHLGEDAVHGIVPRLDGRLGHAQHVRAVLGELAAEEQVHQVDLPERRKRLSLRNTFPIPFDIGHSIHNTRSQVLECPN